MGGTMGSAPVAYINTSYGSVNSPSGPATVTVAPAMSMATTSWWIRTSMSSRAKRSGVRATRSSMSSTYPAM